MSENRRALSKDPGKLTQLCEKCGLNIAIKTK